MCSILIIVFYNVIYSYDGKAEFSTAITPVFSVTWFFCNLICLFGAQETILIINIKKQHSFDVETFKNIFTVTLMHR